MGNKRKGTYGGYITPSYKRAIRDNISDRIDGDYFTNKVINSAIYKILGKPGQSGGKAQQNLSNSVASGMSSSAYTSAQMSPVSADVTPKNDSGIGLSWLDTAIASVINIGRDLLGYAHADKAAKVAYERQEESYNNHFSMAAKVNEYSDAGLNPMALAGAGTGANSTPNVSQGDTPSLGDMGSILGALLNYKTRKAEIEVMKNDVASKIEYRASQKLYQDKINDWFDTNQVVSIQKMQADTADALQRVQTGKAQEELNRAGVTQTEAEAALKIQEALQKEWENTPAFRNATVKLMDAQSAQSYANAKHAYEDIKNLETMRGNIVADTALKYAQTDIGRQELINLGFTAEQLKFAVDHQRGDLIWDRVGKVTGALKDVGLAAGGIMTGISVGPAAGAAGAAAKAVKTLAQKPSGGFRYDLTTTTSIGR